MLVLVVDDDAVGRLVLTRTVKALGHRVVEASGGEEAWRLFRSHPIEVVVSDWLMPDLDGLGLCDRIREATSGKNSPYIYFILLTGSTRRPTLREALERGADDFLDKPLSCAELEQRLIVAQRIARRAAPTPVEATSTPTAFHGMVGETPTMQELFRRLRLAARSDVSVLLHGESGTGKELAARCMFELSSRAGQPFVTINCAALPEELLESELFGHVEGAFTGAVRTHKGLFEQANRGTLFLDEIGEISHKLQVRLLRVLEEGTYKKVGGEREERCDVRVIAATNRNLGQEVSRGLFREDLYYRINVFPIYIPTLEERLDDLVPLALHFLALQKEKHGKPNVTVDPHVLTQLRCHSWPGNIRELRHAIEHAFVTLDSDLIESRHLPPQLVEAVTTPCYDDLAAAQPSRIDFEFDETFAALERSGGNRGEAARLLGLSRVGLWKRIKRLGLEDRFPTRRGRTTTQ